MRSPVASQSGGARLQDDLEPTVFRQHRPASASVASRSSSRGNLGLGEAAVEVLADREFELVPGHFKSFASSRLHHVLQQFLQLCAPENVPFHRLDAAL